MVGDLFVVLYRGEGITERTRGIEEKKKERMERRDGKGKKEKEE
jgi:hypothetical protein